MISRNTVLILGAGASKPFGFPLGRELVDLIVTSLIRPDETPLGRLLRDCGNWSASHLTDFAVNLRDSQRNSVDAFLEHREEFIPVGKAAIVATLMHYESPELLNSGDWYRHLFNSLNASYETFEQNKLSIVTFNYDRSVEFYLCRALQAAYGKGIHEAREKVSAIPIVHLHGKMGDILHPGEKFRPYDTEVSTSKVLMAASEIKIVHESIDQDPAFKKAHKLIVAAEVVCFLGFGYDRTNIKRLCPTIQMLMNKFVYGTAFGLTGAEKAHVRKVMNLHENICFGDASESCLNFLRNQGVLLS